MLPEQMCSVCAGRRIREGQAGEGTGSENRWGRGLGFAGSEAGKGGLEDTDEGAEMRTGVYSEDRVTRPIGRSGADEQASAVVLDGAA